MTVLGQVRTDFGALMKLVAWSLVTSMDEIATAIACMSFPRSLGRQRRVGTRSGA